MDKEPERYYDWILWKFRQEKEQNNMQPTIVNMDTPDVVKERKVNLLTLDSVVLTMQGIDNEKIKNAIYKDIDKKIDWFKTQSGDYFTEFEDSELPINSDTEPLKEVLTKTVSTYVRQPVEFYQWWGHVIPPNASTNYHHHRGEAEVSCVYYVEVPENSGDIIFILEASVKEYREVIKSKTNDLIVFPSFIPHMTGKNKSNKDRISVSANFKLLGGEGV
tara:strand:- start:117 stop:773 length:657 start_codon:yes stop_codon:yes gene_type:complete